VDGSEAFCQITLASCLRLLLFDLSVQVVHSVLWCWSKASDALVAGRYFVALDFLDTVESMNYTESIKNKTLYSCM